MGFDTVIVADGASESHKEENETFHTGDLELNDLNKVFFEFIGFKHFDEETGF